MRFIRSFVILSLVMMAAAALDVKAQTSPTALEQRIFKKINTLPYYGVFDHISYRVDGTQVTLYGKVFSLGTKRDAERTVKRIPGVETVVNNIQELPLSSFDNSIRRQILQSFVRSGGSLYRYLQEPNPSMRIIVENGRVTLEGYVSNRGDANLANILANGTSGVFAVTNNLIVEKSR